MKILSAIFYIWYVVVITVMVYMILCLLWLVVYPPKQVCNSGYDYTTGNAVHECHGEVEIPWFSIFGR